METSDTVYLMSNICNVSFQTEIVLVSIGVKIITVFEQEKMQDYKFLKVLQCLFRE